MFIAPLARETQLNGHLAAEKAQHYEQLLDYSCILAGKPAQFGWG